jgi:hypothetical protein
MHTGGGGSQTWHTPPPSQHAWPQALEPPPPVWIESGWPPPPGAYDESSSSVLSSSLDGYAPWGGTDRTATDYYSSGSSSPLSWDGVHQSPTSAAFDVQSLGRKHRGGGPCPYSLVPPGYQLDLLGSYSIWAPRAAWADSKDLYDTDEVEQRRFEKDWSRALKLGVGKAILKNDDANDADEEADEVQQVC